MAYGDILRRFEVAPDTVLMMDTDDVKVICTTIDGNDYSFNAEWIPEDCISWFAFVFELRMKDYHKNAVKSTKAKIFDEYSKFLNAFGACKAH